MTAAFELPDAVVPVRGASTVDGRPVRERRKDPLHFELGSIEAGATVVLRAEATVTAPLADGTALPVAAILAWEPSHETATRRLESRVVVRSEPALAARRNALQRVGGASVKPGREIEAAVTVANDGTAVASDAVLHVRIDPALDEVRVFERTSRQPLDGDTVDLGTLDAYASRRLSIRAHVRSPYSDRSEIRIGASLHTRELGETPLGDVFWLVDSHPAFDAATSRLELASDGVLRPNQIAEVDVALGTRAPTWRTTYGCVSTCRRKRVWRASRAPCASDRHSSSARFAPALPHVRDWAFAFCAASRANIRSPSMASSRRRRCFLCRSSGLGSRPPRNPTSR